MNDYLHDITRQLFKRDETPCQPHPKAIIKALAMLKRADMPIPRATVMTDSVGVVYLIWRNGWRKLHVMVFPDQRATIMAHFDYCGVTVQGVQPIAPSELPEWLHWYSEKLISEAPRNRPDTALDYIDDADMLELLVLDCA